MEFDLSLIWELLLAAGCGAALGLEREIHRKPAGLRTNMLIAVGATLFTHASIAIYQNLGQHGDPARIAAQIVVGIGFIGAGTILRHQDQVTGLTSAATVWVVAAIGVLTGAGMGIHALIGTALALLILQAMMRIEAFIIARMVDCQARLVVEDREAIVTDLNAFFHKRNVGAKFEAPKPLDGNRLEIKANYFTTRKKHMLIKRDLGQVPGVVEQMARII